VLADKYYQSSQTRLRGTGFAGITDRLGKVLCHHDSLCRWQADAGLHRLSHASSTTTKEQIGTASSPSRFGNVTPESAI
jgi:hypothetical protein